MYEEINFDGLVGPTHNYAGLAVGNLASSTHAGRIAHPRAAALQGLGKMRALAALGVPQAVLPPLERPSIAALHALGFRGRDDAATLARAAREAPGLLAAAASASSMWAANAATVAPSCDTVDGRLHLTPANLLSHLHRSLEGPETTALLRRIFAARERFEVHDPLPGGAALRDEGAANHTRLTPGFGEVGMHLFVYGEGADGAGTLGPRRFPARQTLEASQAVARRHGLDPSRVLFQQQDPAAIDAGVFHNDVIAVGHRGWLFHHEEAFAGGAAAGRALDAQFERLFGRPLCRIEVPATRISVERAVRTYLFNSQIVSPPKGGDRLICPAECEADRRVAALLEELVQDPRNPLSEVLYFDLRESMRNGGGPACLRQRVVMNAAEREALGARVLLDEALIAELEAWVMRFYREDLAPGDLADPALLVESRTALDELTRTLRLGSVYPFQQQ